VEVGSAKTDHVPDESFLQQLFCPQGRGVEAILKRHLSNPCVSAQRFLDSAGLLITNNQRLVTVDVLASRDSGKQLLAMLVVGSADVDDLNVISLDQLAPVRGGERKASLLHRFARRLFPCRRNTDEPRPDRRRVIEERYVLIAIGVHSADKAKPDDANP